MRCRKMKDLYVLSLLKKNRNYVGRPAYYLNVWLLFDNKCSFVKTHFVFRSYTLIKNRLDTRLQLHGMQQEMSNLASKLGQIGHKWDKSGTF